MPLPKGKRTWEDLSAKQKEALQIGSALRTIGCIEGQIGTLNRQLYYLGIDTVGLGRFTTKLYELKMAVRLVSAQAVARNKQEKEQES